MWSYRPTVGVTGATTFDLTALPLPNVAGLGTGSPILTLSLVKAIYILNESTVDGTILYFGNPGANGWTACFDTAANRELVMPGSPMLKSNLMAQGTNPWTVSATAKLLKLDFGAASAFFTLVVVGT